MNTKTKMAGYLLGAASMFMASQASAAMISVTPSVTNVSVDDPFTLTIEGSDFTAGMSSGGVVLSWNENNVQLTSTLGDILSSLPAGMFDFGSSLTPADANGDASVTISAGTFGADAADPNGFFSFATLNFLAVPPPSMSSVTVTASPFGDWQDALGATVVLDGGLNSATVNVSAVPVPAAVWLFGSGLIGLVGVARRKSPQLA